MSQAVPSAFRLWGRQCAAAPPALGVPRRLPRALPALARGGPSQPKRLTRPPAHGGGAPRAHNEHPRLHRRTRPPGSARLVLSLLLLAMCSCAPHMADMSLVRDEMARGDYAAARSLVEKGDENDVLYLMEKGLVSYYAGLYNESNDAFERADVLAEDLYTKSLSREAAALLTSDLVLKYAGTEMERVMIDFYMALNYLDLGLPDDALVECRKINEKLALYGAGGQDDYHDAFLQYITGVMYEWGGELNDALVSYRAARHDYPDFSGRYGVAAPPSLRCDLVRAAKALGVSVPEMEEDAGEEYGTGDDRAADDEAGHRGECGVHPEGAATQGQVVLILELGFIAHKDEVVVHIPILEDERDRAEAYDKDFFMTLGNRVSGYDVGGREVAYILSIAIPYYVRTEPLARVGRLSVGRMETETTKAEDLSAIATTSLDQRMPRILAKTAARAVMKYLAKKGAEEKWGKLPGALVDVVGSATEHADTRSWLTLPSEIHLARLSLPAGTYEASLELLDRTGETVEIVDFGKVEVVGAGLTFLHHRAP
jgi:hypothetical protein